MIIKGKITDETGEPLFGATVLIATGKGVTTDFDGNYTFNASHPDQVIRFSFEGRETKSFKAKNIPTILKLASTSYSLDEVVIIAKKKKTPEVKKKDYTIPIVVGSVLLIAVAATVIVVKNNSNSVTAAAAGLNQTSKQKLVTKKIKLNGNS